MARGSIRWAYGTRQYKMGLRHEAVTVDLWQKAVSCRLMARGSFCCRNDPVVMCHINTDIRITIAVCQ